MHVHRIYISLHNIHNTMRVTKILLLQMRKLKLKNIRYLTQGHAVKKELKTGSSIIKIQLIALLLIKTTSKTII